MVHIVSEDHGDVTVMTVTRPAGVQIDWSRAIPAIASLLAGCDISTTQGLVYQDTLGGTFQAIRPAGPCLSRECDH